MTIKEREESMATGKALDGKPYAGNPHVRFDEGEVAPAATPRRGSLLYKARLGKDAMREYRYYRGNAGRMKYDEYRANGWFIGSGVIESGCKTVIGQRF